MQYLKLNNTDNIYYIDALSNISNDKHKKKHNIKDEIKKIRVN